MRLSLLRLSSLAVVTFGFGDDSRPMCWSRVRMYCSVVLDQSVDGWVNVAQSVQRRNDTKTPQPIVMCGFNCCRAFSASESFFVSCFLASSLCSCLSRLSCLVVRLLAVLEISCPCFCLLRIEKSKHMTRTADEEQSTNQTLSFVIVSDDTNRISKSVE